MAGTAVRRAPYKDFLQPALHRRFSSTATLLLAVAYLEALTLASWSSFLWSWFPIGPAGARAFLIFLCGLAILILRIAQYHVGVKTESGLQTLKESLLSFKTYETLFWYAVSSFLFCSTYLGTLNETSRLQWITYYSGDRPRLNERPLFMVCYLGICALLQTIVHFQFDLDRLNFGTLKGKGPGGQGKSGSLVPASFQTALRQLPSVFGGCVKQSVSALLTTLMLYYVIFRPFAWSWALMVLRPFYNLPRANILPPTWPTDIFLMIRCIWSGALLNFIWATANTAFSVFMAKAPLKNDTPLTAESKDKNGSLLNGLKNKKLSIRTFAMWELAIIAEDFEAQRRAIFADIDRKDGPMWSQVYTICMGILKGMEDRVDAHGKPLSPAAPVEAAPPQPKPRSTAPLKEDEIFSKPGGASLRGGVEKAWDQVARSPGSSPMKDLSPLAKKTWKNARDRMLSKEQQNAVSPDSIRSQAQQYLSGLLHVEWIGSLFRQEFGTELAATVLGTPYAEPTLYTHAAQALCHLAIHSLAEDQFGNVHRDVPSIIRTLTSIITKVEGLKARFPVHWTDSTGRKDSPEVDDILDVLRAGLELVVTKFEPFSSDLRLSLMDLRLAKEVIAKPKEMAAEPPKPTPKQREDLSKSKPIRESRSASIRQRAVEQKGPEMEQVR